MQIGVRNQVGSPVRNSATCSPWTQPCGAVLLPPRSRRASQTRVDKGGLIIKLCEMRTTHDARRDSACLSSQGASR
jgi:hypothetical protein